MHWTVESLFVGAYSYFIFGLLSKFIVGSDDKLLFYTGFLKHFLGNLLDIHTYYCNNGYACTNIIQQSDSIKKSSYNLVLLIIESIFEGIAFIIVGRILNELNLTTASKAFVIGVLLHSIAEISGMHHFFCSNRCI
jgi:hypothetical protein